MSERGVGSSRWVENLAKGRWGLSFADNDPWHDTQWQDCRADLEEKMDTILIPRTRAWARAFVFGETTDDVLQYPSSDLQLGSCLAKRSAGARRDLPRPPPPPSPSPPSRGRVI